MLAWFKRAFPWVGAQRRVNSIMSDRNADKEIALRKFAKELGCSLDSTYSESTKHHTEEVIRRIQEAARSYREDFLWLIAFASALASALSALAAWCAVFHVFK